MILHAPQNTNQKDWDPEDIIAALHKRGVTFVSLARMHGLAESSSFSACLNRPMPTNEKRIADALEVHPATIWPSRYDENGKSLRNCRRTRNASHGMSEKTIIRNDLAGNQPECQRQNFN